MRLKPFLTDIDKITGITHGTVDQNFENELSRICSTIKDLANDGGMLGDSPELQSPRIASMMINMGGKYSDLLLIAVVEAGSDKAKELSEVFVEIADAIYKKVGLSEEAQ